MPFGTVDYTKLERTRRNLGEMFDRVHQNEINMANLRAQSIARAKQQQQEQELQQLGNEFSSTISTPGITPEEVNKRLLSTRVKAVTGNTGTRGGEFAKNVDEYLKTLPQPKQPATSFVDREVVENGRKKGYRDFYNPTDIADATKTEIKPIRSVLIKDEPYVLPAGSGENQEAKDIEKYRSDYNEANATVKQLEDVYGKEQLKQWNQDAAVKTNVNLYGDDPNLLIAALNSGKLSPEDAQKVKTVTAYTKAVSAKKGQDLNLQGKGYYVGDDGKLYKGKKPEVKTNLMSQEEFIKDFEKDTGRKPIDTEIAKAKGKYWQ